MLVCASVRFDNHSVKYVPFGIIKNIYTFMQDKSRIKSNDVDNILKYTFIKCFEIAKNSKMRIPTSIPRA